MGNTKRKWENRYKHSWTQRMKMVRKAKRVKDKITRGESTNYNNNVSDGDNCISNSDEAYDCSVLDLTIPLITVWDGIVQTDETPSIPTVGAVKIPEEEICDCGSPDSAVKIPEEEICDYGSPDSVEIVYENLVESRNEDEEEDDSVVILYKDLLESMNKNEEEDDPNVIYISLMTHR